MSDRAGTFQRDFYDRHYAARAAILEAQLEHPLFAEFHDRLAQRLLAQVGGDRVRVNEQACGEGLLAAALVRVAARDGRSVEYHGADVSSSAVDLAATAVPDGAFSVGDAITTTAGLARGSVDLLVAKNLLHHLADPIAFLRAAARALAPGGAVVAIEPTRGSLQAWVFNALAPRRERYWFVRGPAAVRGHFAAAGMPAVSVERFSWLPYELAFAIRFDAPRRALRSGADRAGRVDDALARVLPPLSNYRLYVGRR